MLVDHDVAAWAQYSPNFGKQARVFVSANMMKHAGGKGAIERRIGEGQAHAVEGHEVRVPAIPGHANLKAS
jgi:hypothetical protein